MLVIHDLFLLLLHCLKCRVVVLSIIWLCFVKCVLLSFNVFMKTCFFICLVTLDFFAITVTKIKHDTTLSFKHI